MDVIFHDEHGQSITTGFRVRAGSEDFVDGVTMLGVVTEIIDNEERGFWIRVSFDDGVEDSYPTSLTGPGDNVLVCHDLEVVS